METTRAPSTRVASEEGLLLSQAFPVLRLLLKYFECNPVCSDTDMRMVEIEEELETGPGGLVITSLG